MDVQPFLKRKASRDLTISVCNEVPNLTSEHWAVQQAVFLVAVELHAAQRLPKESRQEELLTKV